MTKYDYNLIVIGGGTAGLISAYVANFLGAKVALVEANKMGGDCLNTGCVPSKTLIASAHAAASVKTAVDYGVETEFRGVDYAKVNKRIHAIIDDIKPADSAERYRKLGVDVYEAQASWVDPHTILVQGKKITARRIIIACGSRPALPKIPGINSSIVCTSDSLWDIKKLPKSLVIIGGGPIGCELASAYSQLGSKVTLIESHDHTLQFLTKHQAEIAQSSLLENGVKILFKSSVSSIDDNSVTINDSKRIKADLVIVATGRSPNTEWLKDSGIELDGRGYVKVNKSLKTNLKSVYACGDVTGGYQFTHVAAYEASYASSNAIFDWTKYYRKPRYDAIPWTIFTTPEIAHVGISVKNKKPDHVITHLDLSEVDRAKTEGKQNGGIWLISDKKGTLLGATIIADQASSLIGEATLAVNKKLNVKDIFNTIHVYPSYGAIYSRAASKWQANRVSERLISLLSKLLKLFR